MLLAPDVPVLGLDAPSASGFLDLRLVRETWLILSRGVRLLHVIIGSWIASLSFNRVCRASFSRALIMRMPPAFPKAYSPPPLAKRSTGAAKIPSGRCRLAWLAAPSK